MKWRLDGSTAAGWGQLVVGRCHTSCLTCLPPQPHLSCLTLFLVSHSRNRIAQVESITDSTQALLVAVSEGRELPKAELDNLQKKRRLIRLE